MKRSFYSLFFMFLLLTGCSPTKVSVSDELKTSNDEYIVKGVNGTRIKQKISFGDYATTGIKRSWIKGSSFHAGAGYYGASQHEWVNIISTEYINRRQSIRFALANGNDLSDVYCVSRFNSKALEIGKNPNSLLNIGMEIFGIGSKSSSNYYVQIFASEKDGRPWEMLIDNELAQTKAKKYIGYLAKSRTEYYSVVPITKLEVNGKTGNMLAGSIGFEFRNPQGQAVAAVSNMKNGIIILGKVSKEERFLLANACTALLLQDALG